MGKKTRPKKYIVKLTDDDVRRLKAIIRKKDTSRTIRSRCQIILDMDELHGRCFSYVQCAKTNGVCTATVFNTLQKYSSGGIDRVIKYNRSVDSDNARRKVDGRTEARIIEIACSPAPEGHSRWTLRLLEERCRIELEIPVGKNAIGRALKKQVTSAQEQLLVHPQKR